MLPAGRTYFSQFSAYFGKGFEKSVFRTLLPAVYISSVRGPCVTDKLKSVSLWAVACVLILISREITKGNIIKKNKVGVVPWRLFFKNDYLLIVTFKNDLKSLTGS